MEWDWKDGCRVNESSCEWTSACADAYESEMHNGCSRFDGYGKVYEVENDMGTKSMDDPTTAVDIAPNFVVVVVVPMQIDEKHLVNEWNQTETESHDRWR